MPWLDQGDDEHICRRPRRFLKQGARWQCPDCLDIYTVRPDVVDGHLYLARTEVNRPVDHPTNHQLRAWKRLGRSQPKRFFWRRGEA